MLAGLSAAYALADAAFRLADEKIQLESGAVGFGAFPSEYAIHRMGDLYSAGMNDGVLVMLVGQVAFLITVRLLAVAGRALGAERN